MLLTRTRLMKMVLAIGMLTAVGASGSASARPLHDLFRLCCTEYICVLCLDNTAPPEANADVGNQTLQNPLLAIVEDRCGRQTETADEDFAGIPYAGS